MKPKNPTMEAHDEEDELEQNLEGSSWLQS